MGIASHQRRTGRAEAETQKAILAAERAKKAEAREANALREDKEQRENAEEYLAESNELINFLIYAVLGQADVRTQAQQGIHPKPQLTLHEALNRAVERADTQFEEKPRLRWMLLHGFGLIYGEMGEYD
ncbi:hypothetical protein [Aeoliella sp.]|uniref:hypothetical protein n=1 Tax=Aeoliella sp. TaxID=2795800 RepID=UPI003CCC2FBD